jgi:hypothetical protein
MSEPMDHAAAHERIEDLLLEPARRAALETSTAPEDAALREHLSGCAACAADLASWGRLQVAVEGAIPRGDARSQAAAVEPLELPPSLRARVLAAVAGAPVSIDDAREQRARSPRRRVGPLVGLAAGIALLAGTSYVAVDQVRQRAAAEASAQELEVALAAVDRMLGTDHRVVELRDTTGASAGTISWSRHDWVVLTTALDEPAAGSTYRCWLVENGSRSMAIGQMQLSGGLAFWATSVDEWQTWEIGPTTEFIVTLESTPGVPMAPGGRIVLSARLGT